jgi:4-hydroxybenzoate polyprenyltransferase
VNAGLATSLLVSLRPRQWTKNLLLFAGLVFSQSAADLPSIARAASGCLVFCLLSGAVYLFNDCIDAPQDRRHPLKRQRPIAAGRLPVAVAKRWALGLALAALAASWLLGVGFGATASAFAVLNLGYSLGLKRIVILDVVGIAVSFVLRAVASVEVLRPVQGAVPLSPWLILCTFLLALFLGFAKRRAEYVQEASANHATRPSLRHYGRRLLDVLVLSTFAATLTAYVLYTLAAGTVAQFGTTRLLFTAPFVAAGLGRYLVLVFKDDRGGRPHEILLTDPAIQVAVLGWITCVCLIIGLHR